MLTAALIAANVAYGGQNLHATPADNRKPGARAGYRLGDATVVDAMMFDGLTCGLEHCSMGEATERYTAAAGISRHDQDVFAAASHERAANAVKAGRLAEEITPVAIAQRKGDPVVIDTDEGVRWPFSFLSADRRRSYCLYEAPSPDMIVAAARRVGIPADAVVEVSRIAADMYV